MWLSLAIGAALGYWFIPNVPRIGAAAIGAAIGYAISSSLTVAERKRELGREVMLRAAMQQHKSEISAQKTRP